MENKTAKYLLYAIGEIALVVIGILIALQIDTWNEERKERQTEKEYYLKLLEDLKQDELNMQEQIKNSELRIEACNQFIAALQKKKVNRSEVTNHMFHSASKITFIFRPSIAAFEDLKSSGNLRIINDQNLKGQLIDYYTRVEGLVDVIGVNSKSVVSVFLNTTKDFVDVGWQDIEFVKAAINTKLVDLDQLNQNKQLSKKTKKMLLSDAVLYLGNNARILFLNKELEKEIKKMKSILVAKVEAS